MKALILEKKEPGQAAVLRDVPQEQLPEGEVLVRVQYSGVNYKDALAVTGVPGIVRRWPMVAGIDFAGIVEQSSVASLQPGQAVAATGYGLGEAHWGGYAEYARVPAAWLCPIPEGRDARWAMALGTAGVTAMLSAMALEEGGALAAADAAVAVSGAGGGVGGIAIAVLQALGVTKIAAVTGRADLEEYLRALGATELVSREEASRPPGALESVRWSGAVDTVGGPILARLIAETGYGGTIAISGMAASMEYPGSVVPFILRGLSMVGIESVACPLERRTRAWQRLDQLLSAAVIDRIAGEQIPLEEVPARAAQLLGGQVRGRLLVAVGD